VGIFNITKYLARRGHKITLLTYKEKTEENLSPLREVCNLIIVDKIPEDSLLEVGINLFSGLPYKMSKYRTKEFETALRTLLRKNNFDIMHVDHLHMAYYGVLSRLINGFPVVLRAHNVETVIVERYAQTTKNPIFKKYLHAQLQRLRQYEAKYSAQVDLCCMITEEDRKRMLALNPKAHTCVIPGGVDPLLFSMQDNDVKKRYSICFFGSFAWLPNRDGVEWFMKEVFPRVLSHNSEVVLYIIGRDIPPSIRRYQSKSIVIRGFVSDIRKELAQYETTIVPLRIGGGIRIKILESFAMKLPVVTTSIGYEGIEAQDAQHLLVGDTSEEFADRLIRLLDSEKLRREIAENAYLLADKKYRWEKIAGQFESAYEEVISKTKKIHAI
jgi:glycosyltransferase involved in cell wall biosynthesis